LLGMADASPSTLNYAAWTTDTPTGTRRFRVFRGSSAFVLSGNNPGGPVDWVSDSLPAAVKPVLKGGTLVCRAMLVRNFYEESAPAGGPHKTSDGDEIQMIVTTQGILGGGTTVSDGVTLQGVISPSGYGEGYAAVDRYRLNGKPMFRGFSRNTPDPSAVELAVYPDAQRTLESK